MSCEAANVFGEIINDRSVNTYHTPFILAGLGRFGASLGALCVDNSSRRIESGHLEIAPITSSSGMHNQKIKEGSFVVGGPACCGVVFGHVARQGGTRVANGRKRRIKIV
jgi:hypothetical protein